MIEAMKGFPPKVLAFNCKGHVTKKDYDTVLIPAVQEALKHDSRLRVYYQVDTDFSGYEAGAMWDDFKVGIENVFHWDRVAVVTDVEWIRLSVGAFSFLMPGRAKVFHLNEGAKAREWIAEGIG